MNYEYINTVTFREAVEISRYCGNCYDLTVLRTFAFVDYPRPAKTKLPGLNGFKSDKTRASEHQKKNRSLYSKPKP